MENIKELLLKECDYPLPDKIMESFLEPKSEIFLKRNEILVMGGMINTNIYVVEEGILRYTYMDGTREVTFGFALPGTMLISMHSFYGHQPVFYQIEACCTSKVIKISKQHYDKLVAESHDFARCIIRKSKFPQNPKRSVRFSGKRTKRSVQKRKARNTQKAETKVL